MAEFYHEICTDGQEKHVGVFYDVDAASTLIETLPDRKTSFTINNEDCGNPVLLSNTHLGFCGSYSSVFGVIDYRKEAFWIKRGKVGFHGLASDGSSFAVQLGKKLVTFDPISGEEISSSSTTNKVVAIGVGWSVECSKSQLILFQDGLDPLQFRRSNYIGDIREFGEHLILNERQGALRVIRLGTRELIQEIIPENGSEFRRAVISGGQLLTYTQHYFDEPQTTYIHKRLLSEKEDLNLVSIGVSGHNQLTNGGSEVLFATCQLFDTTTGLLVGCI